jgi:hypothetical protein
MPSGLSPDPSRCWTTSGAIRTQYLNDEYRQLVRTAVAALCRKDHPHCYEEARISGQPDLFMLWALQILFLTSRKHLIHSTFTNRGPGSCLPKRTDSVCPSRQALLTTDIQALVLGIGKECSWCKMAAGDTTVGSTSGKRITAAPWTA